MLDPTDQDIAEALRQTGAAGTMGTVDFVKRSAAHGSEFAQAHIAHARTIAKLRIAVEALEYAHAHAPTSNVWFVVHDALAQIKEAGNG